LIDVLDAAVPSVIEKIGPSLTFQEKVNYCHIEEEDKEKSMNLFSLDEYLM
jgi:hypothetical protein